MDLYISSMLLGAAGLGVMALSGIGSHGHDGGGGHGGHGGHAHGHADGPGFGIGHHTHGGHAHGSHARGGGGKALWLITSPRLLFSFALGFGTAGLLAKPFLGGAWQVAAAIIGGVLFERFVVSPLWNLTMRFASSPASSLESAVTDEATAVTAFDENGQGIVSVEMDGQIIQILATLQANDRALGGGRIRAGQRVRIEEVNTSKNTCTVSLI